MSNLLYYNEECRVSYKDIVISYAEEHIHEKITLQDLADFCILSKYHFAREFKKETGISPKKFVICFKMKQACTLLEKTDLRVCEIAEQLAYEPARFSVLFKSIVGMCPTAYRACRISKDNQTIQSGIYDVGIA